MDLTVEGKIYINGSFQQCCIGIDDGKIVDVKKILKSDEHFSFGKKIILPAGIDMHVHFRDPGMTYKEDFLSGSMAAAFGGMSCVFDMPNTVPQTTTVHNLSEKINLANKKSVCDFGVYAGLNNQNIDSIESLSETCNGFKIYMGETTNSLDFDNKNLRRCLEISNSTGKPVLIHAEDSVCLKQNKTLEKDLSGHLVSHPSKCEEKAIKQVLESSKGINSEVHICHLSSCEGFELLRKKSKNISFGVTPHHCLFSLDGNLVPPPCYKVNPPIRTNFDKETLFNAVKNGFVDVLESDHAPHTIEEKEVDFNKAPSGLPGVETMYPLFLYMAKKEIISFQRLVSLICEKPASIMGISKGRLQMGMDADFIVVDLKKEKNIVAENLHSRCGWSPFSGWPALFPDMVFIRGEKVIDDNEIQVSQGFGRFVGA